jgi:hypothetical protein
MPKARPLPVAQLDHSGRFKDRHRSSRELQVELGPSFSGFSPLKPRPRAAKNDIEKRRLGMPSPPKHLGVLTSSHATKQWPPCTSRRAFPRKARQTLVKASSVSGGTSRDIRTCTIIAERVDWTRIVLPPKMSSFNIWLATPLRRSMS